ncbi:putative adenine phosphoribosyltransferase [Helianthus annuus]|nr:putative adenine phosphoribosyltransferase [Helianthus annuus]KAJ0786749.1 putative adenine phosphoribosyltransferase [Helianthus annuus]
MIINTVIFPSHFHHPKTPSSPPLVNLQLLLRTLTMSSGDGGESSGRLTGIKSALRVVPNFPKPGIMFQDITTMLLDPKVFKDTVDLFVERYRNENISVVAGDCFIFIF